MRFLNYYSALKNKRRAFTLLELLIVLFIIGILIAIGLYKYQSIINAASETDARTAVRAALINAEGIYVSNNESFGTTTNLITALGNKDGFTFVELTPVGASPTGPSGISTKTIGVRSENTKQVTLCSQSKSNRYYCIRSNETEVLTLASATASAGATTQLAAAITVGNISTSYGVSPGGAYCRLADPQIRAAGDVCTNAQSYEEGDDHWPGQPILGSPPPIGLHGSEKQIAVGGSHTCAITTSQTVKCWGYNVYGQLGDGTTTNRSTPVLVNGITGALEITAGTSHSCARLANGTVKCWGRNNYGQLGDGTLTNVSTPVLVTGLGTDTPVEISGGQYHTCARLASGAMKCWGANANGQLGNGTSVDSLTPVSVTGMSTAIEISAGNLHTCARLIDNTVKCWGANAYGTLGDGTTVDKLSPTLVTGLAPAAEISAGGYHTCARLVDNSVKCWGFNAYGALGDGTTINRSIPTAVSGPLTATKITAGSYHSCGRLTDNTVKCWGSNNYGALGDGTTTDRLVPTAVIGGPGTTIEFSTGYYYSCARLSNSIKCWGLNEYGQLGNGTTNYNPNPVTVIGF